MRNLLSKSLGFCLLNATIRDVGHGEEEAETDKTDDKNNPNTYKFGRRQVRDRGLGRGLRRGSGVGQFGDAECALQEANAAGSL